MGGGGRGRGPGRGGPATLSTKQKAHPIARPSHDYERNLANRAYGDEGTKEAREAERAREAEERQRAREAGQKADLGSSAKYWERVAEVGNLAGRSRPPPSSSAPTWTSASRGSAPSGQWKGGQGQTAPQQQSGWQAAPQQQSGWDNYNKGWATQSSWSAPNGGAAAWDKWGQASADNEKNTDPWKKAAAPAASSDWSDQSKWQPATESRWTALGGTGGARDFSQEEKARRAAERQAEADKRRRARGEVEADAAPGPAQPAPAAAPWEQSAGPAQLAPAAAPWEWSAGPAEVAPAAAPWGQGAGAGEAAAAPPGAWWGQGAGAGEAAAAPPGAAGADQSGAAPEAPRAGPPSLSLAGQGLGDDEAVAALSGELARAGGAPRAELLDLGGNRITDAGLTRLLELLRGSRVRCSLVVVRDNALSDPHALVDLLWDECCGLSPGADLELSLTASGLSNEVFWRMCEACCRRKPRPPLRLHLGGGTWSDFEPVIVMAEKRGLVVQRAGQQPSETADMILL